ncbi:MAG: hypothetical protein Q7O66_22150 [Dehalococcoidia bacterium]|nr:hypothetical protein [Dehalococcoidia bacterium]
MPEEIEAKASSKWVDRWLTLQAAKGKAQRPSSHDHDPNVRKMF